MDTKLSDAASFEAHMAAVQHFETELGRAASHVEVAMALAKAFGDAMAVVGAASNNPALLAGLNSIATDAYTETLEKISAHGAASEGDRHAEV